MQTQPVRKGMVFNHPEHGKITITGVTSRKGENGKKRNLVVFTDEQGATHTVTRYEITQKCPLVYRNQSPDPPAGDPPANDPPAPPANDPPAPPANDPPANDPPVPPANDPPAPPAPPKPKGKSLWQWLNEDVF
jgi:hypothetical protein